MTPTRTARIAGILYLLSGIPGVFSYLYIPSTFMALMYGMLGQLAQTVGGLSELAIVVWLLVTGAPAKLRAAPSRTAQPA